MAFEPALQQALALLQQGAFAAAELRALEIIRKAPEHAPAWFVLGAARHRLGTLDAALQAFEQTLALEPDHLEATRACATVLLGLNRPREALSRIEALLRRRPASADFLADAGIVLEALGDAQAAELRYQQALRQSPRDFRAGLNLATLLARQGSLDEALLILQALARSHAGSAAVHFNLADVLLRLDRYEESLAAAGRALRLAPQSADALMLQGLALAMLDQDAQASASFANANRIDPAAAHRYRENAARAAGVKDVQALTLDARQIRLARLLERQKTCDWRERSRLIDGMRSLAAELRQSPKALDEMGLYHTALSLPLTAAEQQALAQGVALSVTSSVSSAALASRTRAGAKIRLGFLSPNFREHPSAQQHWRHLALRDRDRFETFAYSLHPGEGPLRERIVASVDVFREVSQLGSQEIAKLIVSDRVDILVDLSGHMDFSRPEVLALRPAPLQVSYMGLPATMGASLIDYRITDERVTSQAEAAHWSEKLVFLPETLWMYSDLEEIADRSATREECGLPEEGFVFCCFNAHYKIEPGVFDIWMRLLRALPQSVLWLLDGGEAVRRNLSREAAARGIEPKRLVFAPKIARAEHLARHACADLFLDTCYYNAHTTAADALWAGLPVLTCLGHTMAARIGASIVQAANLPELIVGDPTGYEAKALALATHPEELAVLRERLMRQRTTCPMFNTSRRVRELDRAFEMMWQRHLAGLPPENFAIPSLA